MGHWLVATVWEGMEMKMKMKIKMKMKMKMKVKMKMKTITAVCVVQTCPQDPVSRLFAVLSPLVKPLVQVTYCGTRVTTQSNIGFTLNTYFIILSADVFFFITICSDIILI